MSNREPGATVLQVFGAFVDYIRFEAVFFAVERHGPLPAKTSCRQLQGLFDILSYAHHGSAALASWYCTHKKTAGLIARRIGVTTLCSGLGLIAHCSDFFLLFGFRLDGLGR